MREFNSAQEKILDRTLFVIGQKGSFDVSIRDITKAAGVNVNAINYYFGTKEALFDKMEEFFIDNYLAAYSVLDNDEIDDEQKLILWANEIMEYTLQYPGIQIILRDNMGNKQRNGKMSHFLAEQTHDFSQKVNDLLSHLFEVEGDILKLMRITIDSAISHPAIFGTTSNFDTAEIKDKTFRLNYIKFVIQLLKTKGIKQYDI